MATTIKLGSSGSDVSTWQGLLTSAGFPVDVSGTFDAATDAATRAWQSSKGLEVDGIVGHDSWTAMGGAGAGYTSDQGQVATDIAAVPGLLEHTDNAFRYALAKMASRLLTNPDYLAAAMAVETGKTFDPAVKNPLSGAIGLIQFMPTTTAPHLGTTAADLASMTAVDQLEFVEKYFLPFKGKMNNPTDAYLAVFWPSAMGKSADYVIANEGSKVYEQNKGFDKAKKGFITAGDVGAAAKYMLDQAAKQPRIPITPEGDGALVPKLPEALSWVPTVGIAGLAMTAAYLGWRFWTRR